MVDRKLDKNQRRYLARYKGRYIDRRLDKKINSYLCNRGVDSKLCRCRRLGR